MPAETVLVVEDDPHIAKLVKYNLEKSGYRCQTLVTGESALEWLEQNSADCIILDVMLPKMDGFETCRFLKQNPRTRGIPLMMLTARGEEVDRVVGLELGADDYMVKPFSPRELVLRVRSILKRGQRPVASVPEKERWQIGDLVMDIPAHRVTAGGKAVTLTAMEFKLLLTLVKRRGRVQTREQLLNDVWNIDAPVMTRTVDAHVKRLRQKLGRSGDVIETVRGLGYCFREETEE